MTHHNEIPAWVVQEVGRLQLELVAAQQHIVHLEEDQQQQQDRQSSDFSDPQSANAVITGS